MNYGKIKLKHVVAAILVCLTIVFLTFHQESKATELEKAKERMNQTLDKLLDSLEDALKGTNIEESEPNIPNTEPNDAPVVEWETIVMNVSAYCPCEICCEDFADGITAGGHKIQKGDKFVAAPSKYPFGTEMIIPGYANDEVVEVKDVGGATKGNKLDLFFFTHKEALEWGRKKEHPVKVKINLPEK